MIAIKNQIADFHYRMGKTPWVLNLLSPLAWVYGLVVSARLALYRLGWFKSVRPDVPVISIGNLTTGGTGKTPIVIEIAQGLIRAGKTVVILSRGYGAAVSVRYGRALDPAHGDEAYMIQEQVPEAVVIVGKDRLYTLKRALRDYRPDYVLLDDGYQYLRLERMMNILLVDGSRLIGNGRLLPVGPLREPLEEIRRADLVFLTRHVSIEAMQAVETWVRRYATNEALPQVVPVPFYTTGLRSLAEHRTARPASVPHRENRTPSVIAFSAIAHPASFESGLHEQGFTILHHERFSDHHIYKPRDVQRLLGLLRQHQADNPILVTTDKDLPKVRHLFPEEYHGSLYTLQIRPSLDGRWFYDEFLTQMTGFARSGGEVRHSRPTR